MPRKRQPRSGPYRAPRVNALAFRDTIVSEFEPAQGAAPIETFTIDQLLPSLKARTVILENFVVEVLPAINPANVTETTGQVRFRTPGTGYVLADAPFKMVSAVNPTQLGFNVQKMARQAPNILQPLDSDGTNIVLEVNLPGLEPPNKARIRVTTYVTILPQISV